MSHGFCLVSRAGAVVMMLAAGVASAAGAADPCRPAEPAGPLDRLLDISDQNAPAGETPEQATGRRSLLLEMLSRTPRCFVPNPTEEQLRHIEQTYRGLPVGQVLAQGLNQDRFFIGASWAGTGGQGSGGQAARVTLRYSFPDDNVSWRDSVNSLNSAFVTRFGAANTDRGREFIRQAFASWRRYGGLTYNEVVDTNVGFSNSTSPVGGGDVRIGASTQGNTGVLAYNFFPNSGGDMAINASELTATSLFSSANNYRYFRNVIAHEHGHGLGFIHPVPCNQTKLMEPFASTAFEMTQMDEIRAAQSNYGDRFAGNNSAPNAKDFGNLTSPAVKSIIERNLSTNGVNGPNNTDEDWFKFTLGAAQNVVITVTPTGGSYNNAAQTNNCNPSTQPLVNAQQAGNLNVELKDSLGNTQLFIANTAAAGSAETITANNLAAGTYTVRVFDVGPNDPANQTVQVYDLTIRVGTSKAPPQAVAGVNKRIQANQLCFFMGDLNSRVNETGAVLNNASFDWDLDGDGIFETNDTPQPTRTYTSNGVVNVTLRVTDSNGMSATDTISVNVGGAVPTLTAINPNGGQLGATIPVTFTGSSLSGVTSTSQIQLSPATGITVTGTPTVSGGGTTVTGLSFVIAVNAPTGPRNVTITNADGTGQTAAITNGFSVVNTPPANDVCSAPISWGSITGLRPFSNTGALTGTQQSFPSTGCPAAGPINNDVWYSWTAPSNGNLNINTDSATAGTPTPFNSRVAVYNSTSCPATNLIGCDDLGTAFNVFVQGGRTYLFQVGSTNANFVGTANVILNFTPILGACCDSSSNCSLQPSDACIGGSIWQGSGTTCELTPCDPPVGTCCAANGTCTETDQAGCVGGQFAPGGTCSPNPCQQPSGSCCAADGACTVTEQPDCDLGRVWTMGALCAPNPCPQPTGACCTGGSCATTTQAACADAWQGAGSTCSPNPCQQPSGACCNSTTCSVTTQADCTGSYKGNNIACGPTGNPTTCCPANFNLNSGVTVQDIFDFLAAYFSGGPAADFNQVGGVTVQDIFDFLAAYFVGCPG